MPRLIIAVIAALTLHVLMLMTVLPKHQVVEPEIKGTGQVTVSIVHRTPPVQEVIKETVEEPEQVELPEEIVEPEEEIQQIKEEGLVQLTAQVPSPEKLEPAKDLSEPLKTVAATPKKKKTVSKVVTPETVQKKAVKPLQNTSSRDAVAGFSEIESLHQPEPLETVNRPPSYPSLARKRGWQGTVLLEVDVQSDGMVRNIKIKESSSYELLDREAHDAVRIWRFTPGLKNGEPVPMIVLVPIHFVLQDQ